MYLKRLGVVNYKSCRDLVIDLEKDIPTTLIGINDSGKSAILKAIGLLLDPKPSFNVVGIGRSTSDVSNTPISVQDYASIFAGFEVPILPGLETHSIIIGEFVPEEDELDASFSEQASNQLKWSIESRSKKTILILRAFDNDDPGGRYFICLGENKDISELWNKKDKELQTLRKEEGLTDQDIQNDNKKGRFASLEIIRALYTKKGHEPTWSEAPSFAKDDLRLFPEFRYIDWNTSLTDIAKLANDVMRGKIENEKAKLINEANTLSASATLEVNSEFEKLTRELTADLPNISGIKAQVSFSITEAISDIVINKKTGDGDIRLESQGEGVKRQIIFAFLKWASKQKSGIKGGIKNLIWCFDEPEAHLYPAAQRDLFKIINDLAKTNYQVLLGTHSTVFVDRVHLDYLKRIELIEKYSKLFSCSGVDDVHAALSVRNSDVLFFNKFLVVEGESEEILIPHFYKVFFDRTLEEDNIKLIPLGGCTDYKRNKDIFDGILRNYNLVDTTVHYILDTDTQETGANVYLVGHCDLEDVFPDSLWKRLLIEHCGVSWEDSHFLTLRGKLDKTQKNKKFHELLKAGVSSEIGKTQYLPSKPECASIFKGYISVKADIPQVIQTIFQEKLSNF